VNIIVNNKQIEVAEGVLLCDLIKQFDYRLCVVIINGKHILLKDYSTLILNENDIVKMVRILGGG